MAIMSEYRSPNCTCAGRGEPPLCTAGCDIDRLRVRDHLEDCAFNVWVNTDNHRHDCAIRTAARGELNAPDDFARKLLAAITADPDLAAINVGAVMKLVNIVIGEVSPALLAQAEAAFRETAEAGMTQLAGRAMEAERRLADVLSLCDAAEEHERRVGGQARIDTDRVRFAAAGDFEAVTEALAHIRRRAA